MPSYYKVYTAKAPVNIAVIKYWGKKDEKLKLPINDSLSGTLDLNEMCATTSVAISDTFKDDKLWLNGQQQDMGEDSLVRILLEQIRSISGLASEILQYKVHIVSHNNFPTAAGLASSAAGYACLAHVLGQAYGIVDLTELSKLARRGSGSACRSLFGGFVQWDQGEDHHSSRGRQIVDQNYWPDMRVIICVVSDNKKDVSSSKGMSMSVSTSSLIKYRAMQIVPERISEIKAAIISKNFDKFAQITMQDSNQFHAICMDTYPPLFYLNDTSRQLIKICTIINLMYGCNKVAYTFDAGPNACIYLLNEFVPIFIGLMKHYFPSDNVDEEGVKGLRVEGRPYDSATATELEPICEKLNSSGIELMTNALSYLINTALGSGSMTVDEHIDDKNLRP